MLPNSTSLSLAGNQTPACTLDQAVRDLVASPQPDAHSIVLDEVATDLRAVIHCAAALIAPCATQHGISVKVKTDSAMASEVLVDGPRLGQLLFYMLLHVVRLSTHTDLTVILRDKLMNRATQRVTINVVESGSEIAQRQYLVPFESDQQLFLPFCQALARRMRGEVIMGIDAASTIRASFTAPFTIEHVDMQASATNGQPSPSHIIPAVEHPSCMTMPDDDIELFERRYLIALQEEGVNLQTFLTDWRHAMSKDIERLISLYQQREFFQLRAVLHRLSGAVGLIGAHHLREALHGASTSSPEFADELIETLVHRMCNLIKQLDASISEWGASP